MALSQWTSSGASGNVSLITDSNKIEGVSSVRLQCTSAGDQLLGLTSGAAVDTGKIRTIVTVDTAGGAVAAGVFGMIQNSIVATNNAYLVSLQMGSNTIRVYKDDVRELRTNGGGSFSLTPLTTGTADFTVAVGGTYAVELKWQRDVGSGFVVLNIATSPSTVTGTYDFSTLVTKITYTDNSSPLSSGVSAGIFRVQKDSGVKDSYFDKTQIFRV